MPAFESDWSGVWTRKRAPSSAPAFVARFARRSKAAMKSGRQSG